MQKLLPGLLLASLVTIPLEANAAQFESADVRTGTFVGARFKMRLGGRSPSRPTASLAIAPTLSRTLTNGEVRTSISEGATLSLGARPTISLMGIRAYEALGFRSSRQMDSAQKLGLSTGGWVAVGVGVAAIAGGLCFVHLMNEAEENSD